MFPEQFFISDYIFLMYFFLSCKFFSWLIKDLPGNLYSGISDYLFEHWIHKQFDILNDHPALIQTNTYLLSIKLSLSEDVEAPIVCFSLSLIPTYWYLA